MISTSGHCMYYALYVYVCVPMYLCIRITNRKHQKVKHIKHKRGMYVCDEHAYVHMPVGVQTGIGVSL